MYTDAQYIADASGNPAGIRCAIGGVTSFVPLDPANSDYQNLMVLAGSGALIIAPAAPSPPTIPARVTRRQARLALHHAGLLDQVEALMASPETPREHRITYEDATEWWRDDPIIQAIGQTLGLTPGQVDALFVAAAAT
jgi:hypothetical protein